MSRNLRLTRRTTVAATQGLLAIEPLLIPADEDLLGAMRLAAQRPSTRVIGVTNPDGRLTGVVPAEILAEAVVADDDRHVPHVREERLRDRASGMAFLRYGVIVTFVSLVISSVYLWVRYL